MPGASLRSPKRPAGSPPLSPSSVAGQRTFSLPPHAEPFSSLPWSELEEQGQVTRAWCRVDRMSRHGFGIGLNDSNCVTQISDPLSTIRPFDTVVAVDGRPLEGLLCEELEGCKRDSIVLTVLRPAGSVDQLLRASAKLTRRRGSAPPSPLPSARRESSPGNLRRSAPGALAPQTPPEMSGRQRSPGGYERPPSRSRAGGGQPHPDQHQVLNGGHGADEDVDVDALSEAEAKMLLKQMRSQQIEGGRADGGHGRDESRDGKGSWDRTSPAGRRASRPPKAPPEARRAEYEDGGGYL